MTPRTLLGTLRQLREPRWFSRVLLLAVCLPGVFALGAFVSDLLLHTRWFGSNPIKEGEHFLGDWTLRFLVATLAITPLRRLTGWVWLTRHRRTLGLTAFSYLMAHWLTYALLDIQLDWHDLVRDLIKRPYIMIGMAGLVMMLPLAITSTQRMMRRLGRRWGLLHRLVYVIPIAGVIHFWMSVKKDISEPLLYAVIFGLLFAVRLYYAHRLRRVAPAVVRAPG